MWKITEELSCAFLNLKSLLEPPEYAGRLSVCLQWVCWPVFSLCFCLRWVSHTDALIPLCSCSCSGSLASPWWIPRPGPSWVLTQVIFFSLFLWLNPMRTHWSHKSPVGGRVAVINLHSAPFTQGKTEWTAEVSSPLTEFQLDLLNQQPPLDVRRSAIYSTTLLLLQKSQSFFHCFLFSIPFYFTPSCCHPPSPSPLSESNHSSLANQKEEEPIKHHSGNLSPGSWRYEPCSGEGRGVTGESYTAVPRWDKVGIVMGITYEDLPSCLLLTHKHCSWTIIVSSVSGP